MEKWIILQQPALLLAYGAALFLCLFDRITGKTKGLFTFFSAVVVMAATAFLLLFGAQLYEASTILILFLLLNMGVKA